MIPNKLPDLTYNVWQDALYDDFLDGTVFDLNISTRANQAINPYYESTPTTSGPSYNATYGDIVPDSSSFITFPNIFGLNPIRHLCEFKFYWPTAYAAGSGSPLYVFGNLNTNISVSWATLGGYSGKVLLVTFNYYFYSCQLVIATAASGTNTSYLDITNTVSFEYDRTTYPYFHSVKVNGNTCTRVTALGTGTELAYVIFSNTSQVKPNTSFYVLAQTSGSASDSGSAVLRGLRLYSIGSATQTIIPKAEFESGINPPLSISPRIYKPITSKLRFSDGVPRTTVALTGQQATFDFRRLTIPRPTQVDFTLIK